MKLTDTEFVVDDASDQARLDAVLRGRLAPCAWRRVRSLIETGKVFVEHAVALDPAVRLRAGQSVSLRLCSPRPATRYRLSDAHIAYVDPHVVVVRKPAGVSAVPFDQGERDTLDQLVRSWLNRTAKTRGDRATGELGVVHRIDKETSGLMMFSRTLAAKRHLANQLRAHRVLRRYLALAHGRVTERTFRSRIVADRGDGLRGSTRSTRLGQEAITHVEPVEMFSEATLVRCTLRTGRTHQIRIHLSEAGHPLLGERVYIRGFAGHRVDAPRLMLHAELLGFEHPVTGEKMTFREEMPDDMRELLGRLREGEQCG